MLRLFACALASAFLLVALAPAAPVPQHLMKPPVYYFPTKVGAKLVYEEPGSETERILVVTAVADRGGAKIVTVGRFQAQGEIVWPYSTMAVTGSGVYRLKRGDEKLPSPEQWLKLPAERDLSQSTRSRSPWVAMLAQTKLSRDASYPP